MVRQLPQPSRESIELTQVLTALGDPVRLAMMRQIAAGGAPLECGAVTAAADVAPSTVSHHFRVLREAGLTSTTQDGRHRSVTVRADDLQARFPGLLTAVLGPSGAPGDPVR